MESPVFIEVPAALEGPELQNRLGAGKAPLGAGQPHAVLHQMAACSLDDARGDGQTSRKIAVIAQVGLVLEEIVGAFVDGLAEALVQGAASGAATNASGHI